MLRVEGRRVDRLLHVHPKIDVVQQELERDLVLAVSARRPERHPRRAVLGDHRRCQGGARSLSRLQRVRTVGVQVEHLPPRSQRQTQPPDDGRRADPSAAGRGRDHVARRVDGVEVGRVAHVRVAESKVDEVARRDAECPPVVLRHVFEDVVGNPHADIAGPLLHRGRLPDQRPSLCRVLLGQQLVEGNVVEVRVPVVTLAVGERQLGGLHQRVDVLGRVVSHRGDIIPFQQRELLQEDGPLRPGRALVDLEPPVLDHDRFLDGGMPLRHVVVGQEGSVRIPCGVLDGRGGDEIEDALRYLALVEGVPCRFDSGYASLPLGGLFCATHDPQHLRVVGIAHQVSDLRDLSIRQVDLAGRRVKFRELSLAAHEAVPETLVQRVPVLRQIYGRREDFREALVPPARDGLGPGSHDRRHGNGQVPVPRYEVDIILPAPIDRERLRRPAQAAEGVYLALVGGVDKGRDFTPDAAALRFHQIDRDAHRRSSVDGVAAVLHDAKTRRRRQVVPRRYDALPSRYNRTSDEACQCISPFLVGLPSGLVCGASGP